MDKGRYATFAFCGVVLLVGYLLSLPKSLGRQFEEAGFHPRFNSKRTMMANPLTTEPINLEFEYAFDEIPKDQIVAFLVKRGYKTVHQTTKFPETTRMVRMNRTFKWRVDDSIVLFGTPVSEQFPKQTTLLRTSHELK